VAGAHVSAWHDAEGRPIPPEIAAPAAGVSSRPGQHDRRRGTDAGGLGVRGIRRPSAASWPGGPLSRRRLRAAGARARGPGTGPSRPAARSCARRSARAVTPSPTRRGPAL